MELDSSTDDFTDHFTFYLDWLSKSKQRHNYKSFKPLHATINNLSSTKDPLRSGAG